jgi:hypothetical protein
LWLLLVFILGAMVGYLVKALRIWQEKSSGTIYVTHREEKTLYSLELEDYPESIAFKKRVVFKVDASDEDLIRE